VRCARDWAPLAKVAIMVGFGIVGSAIQTCIDYSTRQSYILIASGCSGLFSYLKNKNRALKCSVSVLEKVSLLPLVVESGSSSFSHGPFAPVRALFIQSKLVFIQSRCLFTQSGLFSSRLGLIMLNGALFQTERPPSPKAWSGYDEFVL